MEDGIYRELYLRWLQLSAFLPMMRSTRHPKTPREVWRFGEPGDTYYDAIVDCIRLRYMLIPYAYSEMAAVRFRAFHADENAGIRPPHGCGCAQYFRSVHVGARAVMICPVLSPAEDGVAVRDVYLPEGCDWYDFWSNTRYTGRAMAARECAAEQYTDIRARRLDSTDRHGRQVRGGSDVRPAANAIRIRRRGRAVYAVQRRGRRIRIRARRVCHGYLRMACDEERLDAAFSGDARFALDEPVVEIIK